MDRRVGDSRVVALTALIIAVGVATVSGCGGSDDATVEGTETVVSTVESTESTTSVEDGATPPADIEVSESTGFTAPSGNIGCVIDRATVRCDIGQRDWKPPKAPRSCDLDFGQGVELPAGGRPAFVCAGDTTLGAGDPLPYGDSIAAGLLRCESAESGFTCSDVETGRGFSLSIESYELR